MALAASLVGECRTAGSATNGAFFKPGATGTDWSQQDAAQYSVTDAVTDGSTTITSATANFGADVVGNVLYIQGGTGAITAGWYEITARNSATSITVDRSTGLTTGTGATLKIGGALSSPGLACGIKAQGNEVHVRGGTYTISSTTANVDGGRVHEVFGTKGGVDQTNKARWFGYNATRGDLDTASVFTNLPVFQVAAAGVTSITVFLVEAAHTIVRNICVDGQSKTSISGFCCNNNYCTFRRCWAKNCTLIAFEIDDYQSSAFDCLATGCSGTACFYVQKDLGIGSHAYYCTAKGNTTHGFVLGNSGMCVGCKAISCTGANIYGFTPASVGYHAIDCIAYGCGSDGFNCDSNAGFETELVNCIAEGNGVTTAAGEGFGTNGVKGGLFLIHCAGYNNAGGNYVSANIPAENIEGFQAGSASFFTNAAGDDFSLNNTAGGGALLRAAAFPATWPGLSTTNYRDIGPNQHQDAGGGGGGFAIFG